MRRTKPVAAPMVARVYLRVSTDAQDLGSDAQWNENSR
ncbi:Uncharacterised protein [Klebsiella quasipneumoniae]|uniref:Resolvase n=1 Tax=Klebsiella pneumoniae TaxID=573 RepID=A0A2S1JFI4_KLEPN|nr:hypothetical protein [Klebsiella pneumoniae]SSW61929.1 Uncharacterised protein [Klebsiella quasipneumoniae]SXA39830.1 Uncharacterised protein [Klebsiella pneumoniae]SXB94480.1 Uncharacterised protein [Klebsiella pneumoniae]SXB99087.1 Uncharacterised protein [Klebsiella pneumoniae]